MGKKKKIIIIVILVFVMSFTIDGAYAYWAGTINAPAEESDTVNINIGEAKAVNTVLTLNGTKTSGQVLVPVGQVANSNAPSGSTPVEQITFQYTANWNEVAGSALGATGSFTVTLGQITINGSTANAGLIHVFIGQTATGAPLTTSYTMPNPISIATPYVFYITFTMDCPGTTTVYNEVINKPIAIPLTFSVAVN